MTGPLLAVTRRLDHDLDPLDALAAADGLVCWRGRTGVAGAGVARVVEAPSLAAAAPVVADALRAIEVDDTVAVPGTGPIAIGSVGFDPAGPVRFVVPSVVYGRGDDGTRWLTTIGEQRWPDAGPLPPAPSTFTVAPSLDPADWCGLVAEATSAIAAGAFDKVVVARSVTVTADRPFDRRDVVGRLRDRFGGCFLYAVDGFVGASPELLVARHGQTVRAHPMAGTAPRGADPTDDARLAASLLASAGYRHEHQITIDMVRETLLPFSSYVDYEPEPSIVAVANVQHLATLVEGRLSEPAASVLELVAALHPTPAVAGWPVAPAIEWIAEHEGMDRSRYAGTVGWVDAAGNGSFCVAIRGAVLDGPTATVFAGNGMVAGSDPETELAETRAKFQAVLGALIRP